MKSKLLVGLIVELILNTVFSAIETPGTIKHKLDYIEALVAGGMLELQRDIENTSAIVSPPGSPEQLKNDLIVLCRPIALLNMAKRQIEDIARAHHEIDPSFISSMPDTVEPLRIKIDNLMALHKKAQEDLVILGLHEKIILLKNNIYYTNLIASDLDVLGLSRHITICQENDLTCSLHSLFNYLRSRSPLEVATIKSKSSPRALSVLSNLEAKYGAPIALQKAVNGTEENCLWGMALKVLELEPYDINSCSKIIDGTLYIYRGLDDAKLEKIALEFGLILQVAAVEHKPYAVADFVTIDIQMIVNDLPNGDYLVGVPSHYVFFKKTSDEISVYDSGHNNPELEGEVFGFSHCNEAAIKHLVKITKPSLYQGAKLAFHKLTIF